MRLWSLHPKYLDRKGFLGLWREALLAKQVLLGNTKGYINHPQLNRFKISNNPLKCINFYLKIIYDESIKRRYSFDCRKIVFDEYNDFIPVTIGQIIYEKNHLKKKLLIRDYNRTFLLEYNFIPYSHPLFFFVNGFVEDWEMI